MRILVKCGRCSKQYDASGLEVGTRFRCVCGAAIQVKTPKSHEARVVRCSSCGAPRQNQELNCSHCQSDFTIHEKDLNTVCPSCLCRISDRSSFCHSCGGQVSSDVLKGKKSRFICPSCGGKKAMHSRIIDPAQQLSLLECIYCAGFWVDHSAFKQLTARAKAEHIPSMEKRFKHQLSTTRKPGAFYRKCPTCSEFMTRKNFADTSGVVIDVCGAHGIWFDFEELDKVLEFIRKTGKTKGEEFKLGKQTNIGARSSTGKVPYEISEMDDPEDFGEIANLLMSLFSD